MLLPAPPHVYIKTWGMDTNKLACVHTLIVFQCKIKIYIKKKTPCSPLTYIPSQRLPTEIHTQPNRDDWALFLWLKEHLFSFLLSQYPETIRETRGFFFFCDSFLRSKKSYKKRKQKDFIVVKTCVSFTVQCWNFIWKLLHILSNLCRIICLHLGSNIQCECFLGGALEIFWEIFKVNSISRKW